MKKRTKAVLMGAFLLMGAVTLSGCNSSFCTVDDHAHILYTYDKGTTAYYDKEEADNLLIEVNTSRKENGLAEYNFADYFNAVGDPRVSSNVFAVTSYANSEYITNAIKSSIEAGYAAPGENTLIYFEKFDQAVLKTTIDFYFRDYKKEAEYVIPDAAELNDIVLKQYGYIRYADFTFDESGNYKSNNASSLWKNTEYFDKIARSGLTIDQCPSTDFSALYLASMNNAISSVRTCLTITSGYYGPTESFQGKTVGKYYIQGKTWGEAWKEGFFEGLLIYPIGALIDSLWHGFNNSGVALGVCSLLSILITTVVVRSLMLLVTFKQTSGNAKMSELQPEIQKIQNKYPNSKTSNYEKQRMAEEMQKLYKKNKINPLSTIIVLIVQFPVFICVWNAMSTSAALSTGEFAGLSMTATISATLFNSTSWQANASGFIPGVTALILFILMAGAQTVSMLLPQWIQKKKAASVAKLGKNPSAKSQDNKMKWFTYIMLIMIIVMGFSLASAMGVYWLVGAIFSVAQTLITQAITSRKKKGK